MEDRLPVDRANSDVPRVNTIAGNDPGVALGKSRNGVPVIEGMGAVYDRTTEIYGGEIGDDLIKVRGEFFELEVIMGVEEHGPRWWGGYLGPAGGEGGDPLTHGV